MLIVSVAEDSVIEYAPLLPADFRDSRLLPNILALAAEDAEEQRMTAAKLLGKPQNSILQPNLIQKSALIFCRP